MPATHSLLRSRVTRSKLRFESGSAVTEEVYECIFMEQSTLRWVGGARFFGSSAKSILSRFLGLRRLVLREVKTYSGNFLYDLLEFT